MNLSQRLFTSLSLSTLLIAGPLVADPALDAGPTLCRGLDCGAGSRALAGDFDGDGLDDVLVGSRLFFNRGGTFAAAVTAGGISDADHLQLAGDYDGDGRADVIARQRQPFDVHPDRLLLSNGNGSFTERDGAGLRDTVAAFDVDGDARLDLIGRAPGKLLVFRNRGNGFFDETQQLPYDETLVTSASNVGAGDLNGDGFVDLVTAGRDHLYFYFGDARGHFANGVMRYIGLNNSARDMRVADVNLDGKLDVVFQTTAVHVLYGDGAGRFPSAASAAVNPFDFTARESSLIVAPLFGGAPQIVVTLTDGTVVSLSALNGTLRESARTRVDIFRSVAMAGRFRSRTDLDLLAGGVTKDQTQNIAQLVLAEGEVPVERPGATGRARGRAINRAPASAFTGRYDIEWLMACPPAISSLELVRDGIFLDVRTDARGITVEAALPGGDVALRIRDAEGHEYAGYLVLMNGAYTGVLQDYTDSRVTKRVDTCNGSTAIFRLRLKKHGG
jgi:FG-GAP-like repeat